jgi:4-amino-4-deoxy-L-arabinose transferase-like glycosyltransferase
MDNVGVVEPHAPAPAGAPPAWLSQLLRIRELAWSTPLRQAVTLGCLALIPRVIFVLSVHRHGFAFNDTLFYDILGAQIADGHGFSHFDGTPSAQWPPVYPVLLGGLFGLLGNHQTAGLIFNAFIGAATIPLLYFVAYRTFGRREAVLCGIALALMPVHIYFADVLLSETLFVFLLVGLFALLIALPRRRVSALVVGLAVGVCALTRGEGMLLLLIPLAMWWPEVPRRELLVRMAIAAVGVALLVVPWTIRNAIQMNAFIPVSTNGGQTLWSGHNPRADGGPTYPPPSLLAKVKAKKDPAKEVEQQKLLQREARKWALAHPLDELGLIPKKLLAFVAQDSQVFGFWVNQDSRGKLHPPIPSHQTGRLSIPADVAWFSLLTSFFFSLAVFGRSVWRHRVLRGILAWMGLSIVLYGFVLYGNFRYHVPLEPLMMLFVAPLVVRIWQRRRLLRLPDPA